MTSSSPDDPMRGLASFSGIAIIGNARHAQSSSLKTMLDVQIYLGGQCDELVGVMSYWNTNKLLFQQGTLAPCYVEGTFMKYNEDQVDIQPTEQSPVMYDFMGDIKKLIQIGPNMKTSDANADDFPIDMRQQVCIHVAGVTTNCDQQKGTFDVNIEQYISFSWPTVKSSQACTLCSAYFPDSPRYKNKGKPVPYNNKYVYILGFLTDVTVKQPPTETDTTVIDRFHITTDNIAFLGSVSSDEPKSMHTTNDGQKVRRTKRALANLAPTASTSKSTVDSPTAAKRSKKN